MNEKLVFSEQKANKLYDELITTQGDIKQEYINYNQAYGLNEIQNEPFKTFIKPYFLHVSEIDYFKKVSSIICNALEKINQLYFEEPKIRSLIRTTPIKYDDYLYVNQDYSGSQIVTRLDAYFGHTPETLKFLEFNTDSPCGIGWNDKMSDILLKLPTICKLSEKISLETSRLSERLLICLLDKYKEWCHFKKIAKKNNPLIAISIKKNSPAINDYNLLVEHLKQLGTFTILVEPEEFSYDGNQVMYKGKVIDIIYRDYFMEFIGDQFHDKAKQINQAIKDEKICFINPFKSQIGGNKAVLSIFSNPEFHSYFSKNEIEIFNKHIPWTRLVDSQLKETIINNQIDLILKPTDGYGGFNVTIGNSVSKKKWEEALEFALIKKNSFIVQEYITANTYQFPIDHHKDRNGFLDSYLVNLNFWCFNGEYQGAFVRASKNTVINIHQDAGLVPCFTENEL